MNDDPEIELELLRDALIYDDLTQLETRRSYNDIERWPVQVAVNHIGLHDINEEYGRGIGDWILTTSAETFKKHAAPVYRMYSDIFVFETKTIDDAQSLMNLILRDLSFVKQRLETKEGDVYELHGISVYYGIGESLNDAYQIINDKRVALNKSK